MMSLSWRTMAIVLLIGWCGIAGWAASGEAAFRLKVAATIFPLYDMVRQVAGPDVEVVLLVAPGTSPHTMAVLPSMIRSLTGSAATFAIGHGLDDWAVRMAADAGVPRTVFVHENIALRSGDSAHHQHSSVSASPHQSDAHGQADAHATVDPHYWLTIPNAIQIVRTITNTLAALDADGQAGYQRRAADYQQQLRATDAAIRAEFDGVTRRDIALFHSAFGYFAAAYGLHIVTTFAPTPGQEPGPRHVQRFLNRVREHQLRVLFIEPQLQAAALQSVAQDMQMTLKELDPLGGIEGRDTYIALMRFNTRQIATTLRD